MLGTKTNLQILANIPPAAVVRLQFGCSPLRTITSNSPLLSTWSL